MAMTVVTCILFRTVLVPALLIPSIMKKDHITSLSVAVAAEW